MRFAEMSPEDIYPHWLSKLYRRHFGEKAFESFIVDTSGGVEQWPAQRLDIQAPVVCKPCNTEWMSDLENHTKDIIEPIILNPDSKHIFGPMERVTLAAWVTCKAIVTDHMVVTHSGKKPFFSPRQRWLFGEHLTLPSRTRIWVAGIEAPEARRNHAESTYSEFSERAYKHLSAYVFTIALREFAMQLLALRVIRRPRPGSRDTLPFRYSFPGVDWSVATPQIWPDAGDVWWPPTFQLSGDGFELLSHRIIAPDRVVRVSKPSP